MKIELSRGLNKITVELSDDMCIQLGSLLRDTKEYYDGNFPPNPEISIDVFAESIKLTENKLVEMAKDELDRIDGKSSESFNVRVVE